MLTDNSPSFADIRIHFNQNWTSQTKGDIQLDVISWYFRGTVVYANKTVRFKRISDL